MSDTGNDQTLLTSVWTVTLTDGDVPHEPMARLHSCRRPAVSEEAVRDWKRCLGFIPDHVVTKTLAATSQLVPTVEAETRDFDARSFPDSTSRA